MHPSETTKSYHTVLVIAYDDNARATLAASLESYGVRAEQCSTFCEAESIALNWPCKGILVDLATIIKAKAEEKIVAYTLTGFYPTLRVKTMGTMLIPMAMAGDAKQDKNMDDFLTKTCAAFLPRPLRSHKRKAVCIPICIGTTRAFTLNISWSGAFIADMNPERFFVGEDITLSIPDFELEVEVIVARIQEWGQHRPSGIGVVFKNMSQELESGLFALLKSNKNKDHDRLVA